MPHSKPRPITNALWYGPRRTCRLIPETLDSVLAPDMVRLRALASGVSRGTERLVLNGEVPASEHQRMRCPNQQGDFPFPVKYGYALVGQVEAGPEAWIGRRVFALHPHQERADLPLAAVHPLPDDLPADRAVLAANQETALTILWDAGIGPGDRVLVVGGGVLGLLVARLAVQIPGTQVTVADLVESRKEVAQALGAFACLPGETPRDQDVVIHTSATEAGLATALTAAGPEATVVEASWYGARPVQVPLGEGFHSQRLRLVCSQVGRIPPSRTPRWTPARRLAVALDLLRDPLYEALISDRLAFEDAPHKLPSLLGDPPGGLAIVLTYPS